MRIVLFLAEDKKKTMITAWNNKEIKCIKLNKIVRI
jgi:hypothetical protein